MSLFSIAKSLAGSKFILLGDVGYARMTSPTSFEVGKKAEFAEHRVAEGKPLLQWMGPALDEIALTFAFFADDSTAATVVKTILPEIGAEIYGDPQRAWDKLVGMLESREAFPVSMGSGVYLGQFVMTTLSRISTIASENGTLKGIECRVTLREWVDIVPLETKAVAKKKTAKAVKKTGKKKPNAKKAAVPQLDAASRAAGYKVVDGKTIVRQK